MLTSRKEVSSAIKLELGNERNLLYTATKLVSKLVLWVVMDVLKYNSLHLLVCFLEKDLPHTLAVRAYSSLWAQWITHGGVQRPISSARDQTTVVYVQGKCLIHYNPCGLMGTHSNARRVFIK